jgi:membrane-associated protease RseP (regulator of RpoE activity)
MSPRQKTLSIQILLFVITIVTTTISGAEWIFGRAILDNSENWVSVNKLLHGLYYSIPFLGILTIHEFGHYLVARKYKVDVSLPYYIPMWFGIGLSIGTMGAFIRIKSKDLTNKQFFDVGIAGPLAGFVVALLVIWYGFTHLPPVDYVFGIHPEYAKYGLDYAKHVYNDTTGAFYLGDNLIFRFFETYVAEPTLLPPKYEMMHYPFLFAGYLALFFTSLNLLPIGQLDGGHVLYGLVGHQWHTFISKVLFVGFIFFAGLGIAHPLMPFQELGFVMPLYILFLFGTLRTAIGNSTNRWMFAIGIASVQFLVAYLFPKVEGYPNWLVFGFVLGRFLGVTHPEAKEEPMGWGRILLGILALVIFVLCFSPRPFVGI